MEEFAHIFESVTDPRRSNATRHNFHEMLMIGLLCVLSGGEGCADMARFGRAKKPFLRQFMTLSHGIPSHDAFSDLFNALDPQGLTEVLQGLVKDWAECLDDTVIAIDGKQLRRSFDNAAKRSGLHLVHAFGAQSRLVLGQVAVDGKSNEITALPRLLDMLRLKGRTVTADAMHTQRRTAERVTAGGGDYVLALKRNQDTLHGDVTLFLDSPEGAEKIQSYEHVSKDHGRLETRLAEVSHEIDWLQEAHDWPGLQAIGKVTATRESKGKQNTEARYYVMSAKLSPEAFLRAVRAHWSIENSLHWVLDVSMNEDQQRNRKGHGPQNLALMRRLALNIARHEPTKDAMRGKLKRAAWDDNFLIDLIRAATKHP